MEREGHWRAERRDERNRGRERREERSEENKGKGTGKEGNLIQQTSTLLGDSHVSCNSRSPVIQNHGPGNRHYTQQGESVIRLLSVSRYLSGETLNYVYKY